MQKNKVINGLFRFLKTIARVLILNIPAVIILLALMAAHKLSWVSAGISLLAFWAISGIIVFYVFKDLDEFMLYLKKLAQGFEPELPKLRWGIFSSMRLTKTFLSVKRLWFNQFLSDTSVLENLPNPLIMVNPEKNIVFANLSAIHSFGSKLINTPVLSIFKDKIFSTVLKKVLKHHLVSQTLEEFEFHDKSNHFFTFQVKIDYLPAPTKNGAVVAISFFDITPFKLFKMQQADFFANASHELKTPLAIISGCVETLQGPAKNDLEAQNKFLPLIAEQSDRMATLVQNMLNLSRMQVDIPLSHKKTFSINDLIQKVVDDLTVRADSLHKKIVLTKQAHLPLFLANRDDFYHIFQNLLDNALKYSFPESTIRVNTYLDSTNSPSLIVSIHNDGDPIPPEKMEHIWEKFYRASSSSKTEGSGLGLGIVQYLVKKYQGHIEVSSSLEDGTTFSVYFPVEE